MKNLIKKWLGINTIERDSLQLFKDTITAIEGWEQRHTKLRNRFDTFEKEHNARLYTLEDRIKFPHAQELAQGRSGIKILEKFYNEIHQNMDRNGPKV